VDYAGLFPPAALEMSAAVRNYASYLEDADSWMLGRFVIPASRLSELDQIAGGLPAGSLSPWRLAALVGADVEHDVALAHVFNESHRERAIVDVLEVKATSVDAVAQIGAAVNDHFTTFVEIPASANVADLVAAIRRAGLCAKIRTGGVVADAFPPAERIVRFIRTCLDAAVPFKATAGLHHPVRAEYRLTYDADAPTGTMFGYLNVFVAAALMANGLSDEDAVRVLDERSSDAFDLRADVIGWRGHTVTGEASRRVRERVAVSFGSCSFREPVDELRALTLAPA
jgi:hypothetical protein